MRLWTRNQTNVRHRKILISECIDSHAGTIVEYLPSLSAADAWHNEHGYLSQRRLDAFLYDYDRGLTQRFYNYP